MLTTITGILIPKAMIAVLYLILSARICQQHRKECQAKMLAQSHAKAFESGIAAGLILLLLYIGVDICANLLEAFAASA